MQVNWSGFPTEETVQEWDNKYSHDATGHYGAVTKLSVFTKPVDAEPPTSQKKLSGCSAGLHRQQFEVRTTIP